MENWLIFAIAARFFWACTNIVDQALSRRAPGASALTAIVAMDLAALLFVVAGAFLFHIHPVGAMHGLFWIGLSVVGNFAGLFPYLLALKQDEAYNAAPLMEATPVFLTIMAWLFLDDHLNLLQCIGGLTVIASGFLLAWDFQRSRIRLRTLLLMVTSSLAFAFFQLAFRIVSQTEPTIDILVTFAGMHFIGSCILLACLPTVRQSLVRCIRETRGSFLGLALIEQVFGYLGSLALLAAFALAPQTGQVAALGATQCFFLLLLSVLAGIVLPRHHARLRWNREVQIKCLLFIMMAAGIAILSLS